MPNHHPAQNNPVLIRTELYVKSSTFAGLNPLRVI